MEWMIEALWSNRVWNDIYTIMFFWIPGLFNSVAYTMQSWDWVQRDKSHIRDHAKALQRHSNTDPNRKPPSIDSWYKFLSIGELVRFFFLSWCPIVSSFAFFFDTLGSVWTWVAKRMHWLFKITFVSNPYK